MAKVAWIGLGVMGYPMAGHVLKNGGHELTVYNRSAAKAQKWVEEYGSGTTAATPKEAAEGADFVFCCVGNDDDLRSVTTGPDGAFHAIKGRRGLHRQHDSLGRCRARARSPLPKERGFGFLDAPVSGGQAGAENGVLTVMVGGDQATFDRALPVIDTYARQVTLIGERRAPASFARWSTRSASPACRAGAIGRRSLRPESGPRSRRPS